MFLSLDLANLLLYCAQQLGVALGLGAQTILLVAYLQFMRDGVIDSEEAQFSRAVRMVLNVALCLIIVSGVAIGAIEFTQGNNVLLQPAYLFKWALIIFVLLLNVFGGAVPQNLLEGMRGGTWYAIFVVHILAPVTSWVNLFTLYALWMVGFNLVWMALLPLTHARIKKITAPMPAQEKKPEPPKVAAAIPKSPPAPPAPATPAPVAPKPAVAAPLPIVQPLEIDKPPSFIPPKITSAPPLARPAEPPVPHKPSAPPLDAIPKVDAPPEDPWMPAIKVMPRAPQNIPPQK